MASVKKKLSLEDIFDSFSTAYETLENEELESPIVADEEYNISGFVIYEISDNERCNDSGCQSILNKYLRIMQNDSKYSVVYFPEEQITRVIKKSGCVFTVICENKDVSNFEQGIEYNAYDRLQDEYFVEDMFGKKVFVDELFFSEKRLPIVKSNKDELSYYTKKQIDEIVGAMAILKVMFKSKEQRDMEAFEASKFLHKTIRGIE